MYRDIIKERMTFKKWGIERQTGYKPLTTFYDDFSIAETRGPAAVKDTFRRAFKDWRDHYKYLTELVMVLNWKIWEHYENDDRMARLYDSLWSKADQYATEHLKGEELNYFYHTTA